jgi:hypothetical protein
VEVKLRPQIRGTDLKVLGFNIGAQVARGSTVPAGRVFLEGDSTRTSTGRPAVGSAAKHREVQDALTIRPGSCGSSAPRLSWSRPILDIPLSHNERHSIGLLSLYAAAGLCPIRLPHGSRRQGAPLIDYGAVTMGCHRYRSSAVLGASEEISPLLHKEL